MISTAEGNLKKVMVRKYENLRWLKSQWGPRANAIQCLPRLRNKIPAKVLKRESANKHLNAVGLVTT